MSFHRKCHDSGKGRSRSETIWFLTLPRKKYANISNRQLVNFCLIGFLVFAVYYLFSPWRVVIEIRSASDASSTAVEADTPAHGDDFSESPVEEIHKTDHIDPNFGELEKAFFKSIKEPAEPPRRSRDDSIKLIYEVKSPDDWLDLIAGHDDHVGVLIALQLLVFIMLLANPTKGLMALTKATQRYIYDKQHPPSCAGQKFLILNKFPGDDMFGLGAIVQRITDYLSVAIQTNSILLYAEDASPGEHFIQDPAEGGDASCGRSFDCIFQKLSKCKHDNQRGLDLETQSIFTPPIEADIIHLDVEAYLRKHGSPIPPVFEKALRSVQPDITNEMLKYWWRAQAAAYIMRLNGRASSRMKELRLGTDTKQLGIQWDTDGQPQEVDLPFPMPEGTFSMHVRHGDKG